MAGNEESRASFPILEDVSASAGSAPSRTIEGDALASRVGLPVWAWQDASGNVTMPTLTAQRRIPVESEAAGIPVAGRGELAAGSASGSFADVVTISLTANKIYQKISGMVSCRQASYLQVYQNNNGSKTILADIVLDAGQFTEQFDLGVQEVTGGSTGVQTIGVQAFNYKSPLSAIRATVSAEQIVP